MDVLETWAAHMGDMQGSTVYGSKAGLCLDPFKYFTTVNDLEIDADVDLKAWNYRMHNCFEGADDYDSSMLHWIAALKGRVDLLPTSRIALQTMLIQEGIYLSSKLAREVTAQEVIEGSKSSAMAL